MLLSWFLMLLHPFYVSVVDINHNQKTKGVEISIRIFTDDFEQTLQAKYPLEKVDLIKPKDPLKNDSLISRYIRSKMHFTINGKPYAMQYVGAEKVEESTWCYFEIPGIGNVQTVQVFNSILYETRKEQINMHNISVGGASKSRKLDNPETEVMFSF